VIDGVDHLQPRGFGEAAVVAPVPFLGSLFFAVRAELLEGVLADRLEHPEPFTGVSKEIFLDERLQRVEVRVGHLLRGFERAAADEHGQAREQALLVSGEEVV
jgi:hypothetical protein